MTLTCYLTLTSLLLLKMQVTTDVVAVVVAVVVEFALGSQCHHVFVVCCCHLFDSVAVFLPVL